MESDNEIENCEQDDVSNNEGIEITSTPTNTTADPVFKIPTTTKKRKASNISIIENRMEDAYNILKKVSAEPSRDECSLYAELLANKLRALDENTRETAMHEIDNYLYGLKRNQNQLRHQNNPIPINSTQTHSPYPHTFQTYSSQSLHNQLPIEYSTLPSGPGPSQENVCASPQDLTSHHQGFSYSYQPEYSTSSNSQSSQIPHSRSPISPDYSIPSPHSQKSSSNIAFPHSKSPISPDYSILSPHSQTSSSNIEFPHSKSPISPDYSIPSPHSQTSSSSIAFPHSKRVMVNQTDELEPKDRLNFDQLFDKV